MRLFLFSFGEFLCPVSSLPGKRIGSPAISGAVGQISSQHARIIRKRSSNRERNRAI